MAPRNTLPGSVSPERARAQAEMLASRVQKTFKHLSKGFKKAGVDAFRLYDRDIPEIRAVVDWYAGHLVVGEYAREQTGPRWLDTMGDTLAETLQISSSKVHLKRRKTRPKAGARYQKDVDAERGPGAEVVHEGPLSFRVNLDDYLDTGLFLDHRNQRARLLAQAEGKSVLNLFSYTGSFTVAALAGGAKHVTSVDASKTYLAWSQANLRENGLPLERHEPARSDVSRFLTQASSHGRRWDLVIVDPPSYSTVGDTDEGFDVLRDHIDLLGLCSAVCAPGGEVWFSTNHQRFEDRIEDLGVPSEETTAQTVPKDFRNRQIHRSWTLRPR